MSISSMVLRYFQGLHHFLPSAVCRSDDFPLLKVGIWLYQRPKRCLLVMPEFDKVLTRSCTGKPGCWMVYGLILAVDRAQPQPSFFVFFPGSPSATCPTSIITLSARGWGPKIDQNWMMGTFIGKYRAPKNGGQPDPNNHAFRRFRWRCSPKKPLRKRRLRPRLWGGSNELFAQWSGAQMRATLGLGMTWMTRGPMLEIPTVDRWVWGWLSLFGHPGMSLIPGVQM